ncbi:MAG: oxidoreductase [Pseudomonadales bacterium]|nr:oxidoreductase [Pseudomonadales bacterium]
MIKVAVVGYGLSATVFHLPFVAHNKQFVLVAISSSQLEVVQKKYSKIDVYADAQLMIEQCSADLIIITSPNLSHYPLAKLALESGKHVIIEKPMTATSEQALYLAKLAQQQALVLSVYHNRRWDGDFLTLAQLVKSAQLGKIKVFNSHFDRFRPTVRNRWREQPGAGAGILYDLGSHLIDQALCLFGAPHSLTANCAMLRDGATTTDYFQVMLHYANMEVVLQSSPFSADPNIRFQLQGTKGSYIKYGLDPQEDQLGEGLSPGVPAFGVEPPSAYGKKYIADADGELQKVTKLQTMTGSYMDYYNQLAAAITEGVNVPVTALEGAKVIKLIELAELSSATKQRVEVDLTPFSNEVINAG